MYAGDPFRDHFDPSDSSHQAISFQCIGDGYDRKSKGQICYSKGTFDPVVKTPYIPSDIECRWIRPQAFFPNCWNGKDSYLPNNGHVAYPPGGNYEGGACPEGYVRIPSLFLESMSTSRSIADFSLLQDARESRTRIQVVLGLSCTVSWAVLLKQAMLTFRANGDNNGFTFHADWLNGVLFLAVLTNEQAGRLECS
jgi:hypothetical protein